MAAGAQQQLRAGTDLAVRYGGEEFLVVLPDTGMEAAAGVAERIRRAIEQGAIARPSAETGNVVTVGIGVAAVSPDRAESPRDAIAAADREMHVAKQQGRNRVSPPVSAQALAAEMSPPAKT